jgi:hypothetical protein
MLDLVPDAMYDEAMDRIIKRNKETKAEHVAPKQNVSQEEWLANLTAQGGDSPSFLNR